MDAKLVAVFLAVVLKAVLDYIAEPIRQHWPNVDLWWFKYVSLVFGVALCWFIPLNVFLPYFSNAVIGSLLTGVLVGGVPKLLNDMLSNSAHATLVSSVSTLPATFAGSVSTLRAMGPENRSLPPTEKSVTIRPRGW